jgi:hypothetical protein
VSGKGLAHAYILVIAEIFGKTWARVAIHSPAEVVSAAGPFAVRRADCGVRAGRRGFRREDNEQG